MVFGPVLCYLLHINFMVHLTPSDTSLHSPRRTVAMPPLLVLVTPIRSPGEIAGRLGAGAVVVIQGLCMNSVFNSFSASDDSLG